MQKLRTLRSKARISCDVYRTLFRLDNATLCSCQSVQEKVNYWAITQIYCTMDLIHSNNECTYPHQSPINANANPNQHLDEVCTSGKTLSVTSYAYQPSREVTPCTQPQENGKPRVFHDRPQPQSWLFTTDCFQKEHILS